MTITVAFVTVADSISKLSIADVPIRDIDKIPAGKSDLLVPLMYPRPDNFITGVTFERVSLGGGGTAKMDFSYTMTYRYLHAKVGSGVSQMEAYSGLITKIALILVSIMGNDDITGAVDMVVQGVEVDAMPDPAGEPYHGADISLRITEHAQ